MTPRGAEWRGWCAIRDGKAMDFYPHEHLVRVAIDFRDDIPIVPVVVTPEPLAAARAEVVEAHRELITALKDGVWSFIFGTEKPDVAAINALVDESNAALDALAREENEA